MPSIRSSGSPFADPRHGRVPPARAARCRAHRSRRRTPPPSAPRSRSPTRQSRRGRERFEWVVLRASDARRLSVSAAVGSSKLGEPSDAGIEYGGPGRRGRRPGAHEGSGGVRPRARDADLPRADDRRRARVDGWTPRARVARRLRPVTAPRRTALPAVVRPIGRPPRRRRTPAPRRGLPPRHRLAGSGTASSSPRRADQTSRSSLNTRQSLSESNCRRSTNSNPSRR